MRCDVIVVTSPLLLKFTSDKSHTTTCGEVVHALSHSCSVSLSLSLFVAAVYSMYGVRCGHMCSSSAPSVYMENLIQLRNPKSKNNSKPVIVDQKFLRFCLTNFSLFLLASMTDWTKCEKYEFTYGFTSSNLQTQSVHYTRNAYTNTE